MSNPFIEPMLVISTTHIPETIATAIDAQMAARTSEESIIFHETIVYPHGGYGWKLHVSDEANEDAQSPFKDIVALARSLSCNWILLDRDAERHPDLPAYAS